ncbi:non-specific lipid-transfer protein 1-like [Salvia miltiorrhiza]|uniref:non-specific lipid-transfer protein 1-like n=1 Tax=Salvia miltiorrhiza TaxID=226208 RepID=UPI0025AD7267|nr:non-specific lipid-transfer protein 1-like [Salvia miltiorrhiza]
MVRRSFSVTAWIVGLVIVAWAANAVSCPQAVTMLLPCRDYLVNPSAKLTVPCCEAASMLDGMVHSKSDIKVLCSCFKQAATALHVIVDRAKSIPQICHIQVPVPIDPHVDCNR